MSEIESFSGYESGDQGSSPESFRLFQERMKAAAAQIKGIKAGEQKQKKKEDELAKVLADFIKSHQGKQANGQFLMMISALLALNLPAIFILSILIINFPELQKESGLTLLSFEEAMQAGALDTETLPDIYLKEGQLPPHIKVAIDSWIQEISSSAISSRAKLLKYGLKDSYQWQTDIIDFVKFSLIHFLSEKNFGMNRQVVGKFVDYFMNNILEQIKAEPDLIDSPKEI